MLTIPLGTILSFCLTVVSQLLMWFSVPLLGIAAAYLMFWLPQIARSALRGRTAALTTEYLIGMTVCRLLFAICAYLGTQLRCLRLTLTRPDYLGYSENVLQIAPRRGCHFVANSWFVTDCALMLQLGFGPLRGA